jgi:hypothetical protein
MNNDQKAKAIIEATMPNLWIIKELMDSINMLDVDLLRTLYLIENIQRISKWGNVKITIQNGEVTSITGETKFIAENELQRNFKTYQNR